VASLAEISAMIAGELDINRLLQIVMDAAIEISKAERGFLVLIDENHLPQVRIATMWSVKPSRTSVVPSAQQSLTKCSRSSGRY